MGSFYTYVTALMLLSLSITLSFTTAYIQTPKAPPPISLHDSAPKPSSPISAPSKTPNDEEARDLHYLRAHFTSTINKTELMLESIKPWMDDYDYGRKPSCKCSKGCGESFTHGVEDLKKGLASVDARDWETLNVVLTGLSTYISDCDDCLYESPSLPDYPQATNCTDFGKFDAWIRNVTNDFLAVAVKYSTVPHGFS